MRVARVVLDAQVTDSRGDPIPDLRSGDFRVLVDGRPVELESVEWIPADKPEVELKVEPEAGAALAPAAGSAHEMEAAEIAPGRLMVLFFQTSFERLRLGGLMRMANTAQRFLDGLLPTDRVAVVSFDSQLKLRQDFTADRGLLDSATYDAIRTGPASAAGVPAGPSLARHIDPSAARQAATVERGLELVARALEPVPGPKSLLYFGWGLRVHRYPKEAREWLAAMRSLNASRISVFSLDVTDADFHTLEVELEKVSDITGGTYQKTNVFPSLALDRIARRLAGRYVLVFAKPEGRHGAHAVDVSLTARKGEVLTRPFYED